MPYKIDRSEIEKLESLIGNELDTSGSCVAEDEYGVAHNCGMASYTGILQKIDYDPKTQELRSILMRCDSGLVEVSFDVEPGDKVWDIKRGIYHNNQRILEASSKNGLG
jgi:hypothetical protein